MLYGLFAIGILATVIAVFTATMRIRKDSAADERREIEAPDAARESYNALTDSVRQRQQDEIRRRMSSGRCLHCESAATHSAPRWRLVEPLLSGLYRYLGVLPVDHWTLETHVRHDGDKALCEWHHHEAVALMQEKDGELGQKYARLVRDVRAERMEFEQHGLYEEQAASRENVHSRGRKAKRGGKAIASVTPLQQTGTGTR